MFARVCTSPLIRVECAPVSYSGGVRVEWLYISKLYDHWSVHLTSYLGDDGEHKSCYVYIKVFL